MAPSAFALASFSSERLELPRSVLASEISGAGLADQASPVLVVEAILIPMVLHLDPEDLHT